MQGHLRGLLGAAGLALALVVQGCGGGGGGTAPTAINAAPTPVVVAPPAVPTQVTVTGQATFEFVPINPLTGALNYAATVDRPARGVTVQALSNGAVLASAIANEQGNFSITLPVNTGYFLRMRAEVMTSTGPAGSVIASISVKDNTSQNALWVVDGAPSQSGTGNARNSISAGSGWNGLSYTLGARAAGPFAALDTAYSTFKFLLQTDATLRFPPLTLFWSPNNTTARSPTDDLTSGEIGTTFFQSVILNGQTVRSIYVLGRQDDDTDEYDSALISHELGHYLQSAFSSDHSMGGSHAKGDKLDMTLAFAEGWATALSSMARGNADYFDSFGVRQSRGFTFSVLTLPTDSQRGWYREDTVYSSIYAVFQAHGFAPIWQAFTGPMAKTQQALATLFSFAQAVRSAGNIAVSATVNRILAAQNMFTGSTADAFGQNESNNGASAGNLPAYTPLTLNVAAPVCFHYDNKTNKDVNKLGMVKYFRLNLSAAQAGSRTVVANFSVGRDIDFEVFQNRNVAISATVDSQGLTSETAIGTLSAGDVIIRVSDFVTTNAPVAPFCATITVR